MANGKKDEDSLNLIAGLILIVVLALIIIYALMSVSSCPEGTYSCDSSISVCGCCIDDAYGNSIESCGHGICPEGTYFFEGYGCCSSPNPISCLKNYTYCKHLIPCGKDGFCCEGDKCQIQTDGSYECIPCSVGALCNPDNVNGCCEGLACSADGFCKTLKSCVGMECENYGSSCMICSADSTDCLKCEDDTICYKNPVSDKGICTKMCDPYHPVCPECLSGCCNSDGTCASCLNNPCSSPGNPCALSSNIPCSEICANVEGELVCKSKGNCPEGYVTCGCETGCCDAITGECLSCVSMSCTLNGSSCFYCDGDSINCITCPNTICVDGECKKTSCYGSDCFYEPPLDPTDPDLDPDSEKRKCKEGDKIIVVDGKLRLCVPLYFKSICSPTSCEGKKEGDSCAIKYNNPPDCEYICHNVDGELKCLIEDEIIPDWLLNYKLTCIEVCEDCNLCDYEDLSIYDLNEDTYLNGEDLEVFDTILGWPTNKEMKATTEFKKYDFNNDGVIDEIDRNCLINACGDGTCKLIGFEELGICVSDEYYYNSYTEEQRKIIDIDSYMYNIIRTSQNLNCDFNVPYKILFCNEFKKDLKDLILIRNLSHVMLERNANFYHYDVCAYSNNMFVMYIESPTCSNDVNIYFSKELYYKTMANGMALFHACINRPPKEITFEGKTFKGDCLSFSENLKGKCIVESLGSNGFYECSNCKECREYTMVEGECSKFDPDDICNKPEIISACSNCPGLGCPDFPSQFQCGACEAYYECLKCQNYYPGSDICTKCNNCIKFGEDIYYSCSNEYDIDSVDELYTKYKSKMDLCFNNPKINPGNCVVYIECMDKFNDVNLCNKLSINSYWTKNNEFFSKELFCYGESALYQVNFNNHLISYAEEVMKNSGNYKSDIKGTFAGFVDDCPYSNPISCIEQCYVNNKDCVVECIVNQQQTPYECGVKCTTGCASVCVEKYGEIPVFFNPIKIFPTLIDFTIEIED